MRRLHTKVSSPHIFFTVGHPEKSKDFYVRILAGKVTKPDHPCYIKLEKTWLIPNSSGGSLGGCDHVPLG
jgi:hypothetical protein